MKKISFNTEKLYEIIYKMVLDANINLPKDIYNNIKNAKIEEDLKNQILKNAHLAQKTKRPLCQDCGQVMVFVEIGQNITLVGEYFKDVINKAIENCYKENFFRKSIVDDAIQNRTNTNTNTPAIIYEKIVKENKIKIILALKGGGCENVSTIKMFNPTADFDEILNFVKTEAKTASKFACPPLSIGIGIGGTLDYACYLSKLALYEGKTIEINEENIFEAHMLTAPTHIANMPVALSFSCHSHRFKKCEISFENGEKINYKNDKIQMPDIEIKSNAKKISTTDINSIKNLKPKDKILLSGTIYTARDMAHKRLCDLIKEKKELPINFKNSIIFYAGPAPKKPNEIIGPIGPTTSKRMDKYAKILYENGILATIGKGDREINSGIYFKATGGIATLLQKCVKSCKLIAFEDLGTEAVYELEVQDMPLVADKI